MAELAERELSIQMQISRLNELSCPSFTSPLSCISAQSPEELVIARKTIASSKATKPLSYEENIYAPTETL